MSTELTAAAEAIHRVRCCDNEDEAAWRFYMDHATAAVAAARPIIEAEKEAEIRERIAADIEAHIYANPLTTQERWQASGLRAAARIARGQS